MDFQGRLEFERQEYKEAFQLVEEQTIGEEGSSMMKDSHLSLLDG